jgi:hypothetical protein
LLTLTSWMVDHKLGHISFTRVLHTSENLPVRKVLHYPFWYLKRIFHKYYHQAWQANYPTASQNLILLAQWLEKSPQLSEVCRCCHEQQQNYLYMRQQSNTEDETSHSD